MTSSRDENVIKLFLNSLINSSNLYLQDLGSEIALSIMVQEFTRLQNGALSVTPVYIYLSIYLCMYRCLHQTLLVRGLASLSQKCAISDIAITSARNNIF